MGKKENILNIRRRISPVAAQQKRVQRLGLERNSMIPYDI
jgi:hypothetical protein